MGQAGRPWGPASVHQVRMGKARCRAGNSWVGGVWGSKEGGSFFRVQIGRWEELVQESIGVSRKSAGGSCV